ncbi:AAA family ATPase [Streptomyces sp. NBC_01669]|uniref:helix-turn-helix transcriptional regulator n=1 Tax=Streptomyces sp. NBC_01669 TaxID=2975909 RepID=UPI002255A6F8|nr:AAA family ATPase [Streptomyces sp. NBC_01669]MCX4538422.1 AAA family ATPase [Streptomyces sp. NBC_01669]
MSPIQPSLIGRDDALHAVDNLLGRLRGELSADTTSPEAGAADRTLLLLGEPGIGKTSLLEAAATRVKDHGGRARWVAGSPEQARLAFSGLDALVHPWPDTLADLDAEDQLIIEAALREGETTASGTLALADALVRILSSRAVLSPLLVIVDDLQWLDQSTQDLLSLCARRLQGEPVGFLLASRPSGLPPLWVRQSTLHRLHELDDIGAARLLDSLAVPAQGRIRRQIMRQAGGNPLALVELARAASIRLLSEKPVDAELPLTERLEQLFAADLTALPEPTRRLLLLAAVADLPDMAALAGVLGKALLPSHPGRHGNNPAGPAQGAARAAATPDDGIPLVHVADQAWSAAEKAGLLILREGVVRFRHPLVRSAVLSAASFDERARAHRLIASAPDLDEDRRAWHRAAATVTADGGVADALEATAERARRRGGYAAAAMTLERAAQLSPRTHDRVRRLNAAAEFAMLGGHPRWVADLTTAVAAVADTPGARAQADYHAGWALALTSRHDEAMDRLMAAADAWEDEGPARAAGALATAAMVAYTSGDPRFRRAILDRYRRLPPHEPDASTAWILAGCDPLGARDEALAHLRHATAEPDLPLDAFSMLGAAAWALDETEWAVQLYGTMLELYRLTSTAGANATVASAHAIALFEVGRWPAALAGVSEAEHAAAAGGLELATVSTHILAAALAAVRGDSPRARQTLADATRDFDVRGTRTFEMRTRQAHALAALAEGDHDTAYFHLSRLFRSDGSPVHFHSSFHALGDLAASAVRMERTEQARAVLDASRARLPATTSLRLRLIVCRAQGLLTDDARAEELLREAAFTPGGESWPFERALALADLGEWLRRQQRPADARAPLHEAQELFQGLGAAPWVHRTAAELRAAGVDTAEAHRQDAVMELTPQQLAIVQLAAQGLSNKDIATRLFLSPRTVGFHLNRAFPKLGVTSRFQLRDVI